MTYKTLHDIYNCPHCNHFAARGNLYCRYCGIKFTSKDVNIMENKINNLFMASPWNTRDRYRCLICSEFVCTNDKFCRKCGDEFDDNERHIMKAKLSDLAKKNTSSLIGLAMFVIIIVLSLIALQR